MPSFRTIARAARRSSVFGPWRVLTGVLTALGLFAIGLAAHNPVVHEHVHHDAAHVAHACAITLAAAGFCDTTALQPEIGPTPLVPTLSCPTPESFAWTAPDHWLAPALAPPSRTA